MKRLVVQLVLLAMVSYEALASCGSASCPLNNLRFLGAGFFRFSLSREYINQDQIYVGSQRSFVGAIPYHHDEVQTINERSMMDLQVGLTDRLGVTIDLPFITRQHSHIHHHQGQDRKSTRLNSSHIQKSRMPSSA